MNGDGSHDLNHDHATVLRLDELTRNDHEALVRVEEQIQGMKEARELQAEEYERRLEALNGEASRIQTILNKSVTSEKFDDYSKTEKEAREIALDRVNERFTEHVKNYELRQRDVDLQLSAARGAAEQVKIATAEINRRQARNMTVGGLVISSIVVVVNILPRLIA